MRAAKKPAQPALTVVASSASSRTTAGLTTRQLPAGISHQAAQAELNAALFPHYLLGRQLALEETVRELLLQLDPDQRQAITDRLQFHADEAMERMEAGAASPAEDAATCGYICTLLQQGA